MSAPPSPSNTSGNNDVTMATHMVEGLNTNGFVLQNITDWQQSLREREFRLLLLETDLTTSGLRNGVAMMIDLLNVKDRELANITNLVIDLQLIVERQDREKQALNHEIHCLLQARQLLLEGAAPQSNNTPVMELSPVATSDITDSEPETLVAMERLFVVNKKYRSPLKAMGAVVAGIIIHICARRLGNQIIRRRLFSYSSRDSEEPKR